MNAPEGQAGRGSVPRPRPWPAMLALIVLLGGSSALTQVALTAMRERLIEAEVAHLRAIGEIQAGLADSHLWMEEFVAGDQAARGEIWRGIEKSSALVEAMLQGAEGAPGQYAVRPIANAHLREGVVALGKEVEAFAILAAQREARYRQGAPVGAGTRSDAGFDRAFRALVRRAQALRAETETVMARSLDRTRLLSRAILAAWALMVVLAVAAAVVLERWRLAAERALRERDLHLAEAQKLEAVGRLASGLAHDINNYLAAIIAQAELVKRKPPSSGDGLAIKRLHSRMDGVIATGNRAAALIRRLLAFARQQGGRPQVLSLNRVVEELEPLMRQLLGEGIALEVSLAAEPWNISGDPMQVEQIVMNLLVNAREAMPRGGKVTLETRNVRLDASDRTLQQLRLAPGEYAMLVVGDTGVGIPVEVQERIFEPFFSTKPRTENSGLGLATIHGIVGQSGGAVAVLSAPGEGTTFRVYLPRSLAAPLPIDEPVSPAAATHGSGCVLLVEDNDALRDPVRAVLESLGYTVLVARDGAEALTLAERAAVRPEIVVTDVVMPGMSGPQLIERIGERLGPLPVVYVSGHGEGVLAQHGVGGTGHRFLQKPFAIDALASEVRTLLEASRVA